MVSTQLTREKEFNDLRDVIESMRKKIDRYAELNSDLQGKIDSIHYEEIVELQKPRMFGKPGQMTALMKIVQSYNEIIRKWAVRMNARVSDLTGESANTEGMSIAEVLWCVRRAIRGCVQDTQGFQ